MQIQWKIQAVQILASWWIFMKWESDSLKGCVLAVYQAVHSSFKQYKY